jgi:hypothetical protein
MIDEASISLVTTDNAKLYAEALSSDDVAALVMRLDSTEDKIRYPAFLLLRERSVISPDLYPFWGVLDAKLSSTNSYQRSIGAMLISANARHDSAGKMNETLPRYLALLNDPKPITLRQCAQALPEILRVKPELAYEIGRAIMQVDLMNIRVTMRKLVLNDLFESLLCIRNLHPTDELERYFIDALSGNVLDEKAKKQLRSRLLQSM